jgi:glycosyltransferase involved in cell wall biosynthesis
MVSVVVPARNEELTLGACLESLLAQPGVPHEIIVVDDHSSDRTAEIAGSFTGVRIVSAPELTAPWTGKNNAMAAGARAATGQWLLFTDADTVHAPGSLAGAVAEAREHGAALLSYSPRQDVSGLIQKAVMAVIFAELACRYRPREVCDPASPAAAANGQYLLISRDAYDAVGGHAAIASDLLEDVALARAVKRSGRYIFFRYGGDAVRTRMYTNLAQLREGWTKNLGLLFPDTVTLAMRRVAEFFVIVGSSLVALSFALLGNWELTAITGALAGGFWVALFKRIRKAHLPADANLLAIIGLPFFAYLLLRSMLCYRRRNVIWKGRSYPGSTARSAERHGSPHTLQGQTWFI